MKIQKTYTKLNQKQAETLQNPGIENQFTVEVRPPHNTELPTSLDNFIQNITEIQSRYLGLKNTSPITSYEIRRTENQNITVQFTAPTKRLERKIRTQLLNQIPKLEIKEGIDGVNVEKGDSVGGGLITLGEDDWYPIRTDFDRPPTNSVIASLHRHSMQDTKIITQILFRPVAGKPLRRYWWRRRAYKRRDHLKREKHKLLYTRSATKRENEQAQAIDDKAGTIRYHTTIRFLIIGPKKYTKSRLKEIAGAFNIFDSHQTGQYFDINTVDTFREHKIYNFSKAVTQRKFKNWTLKFQVSAPELAALITIPDRKQENLKTAQP